MPPPLDLVGRRFGGLLVLSRASRVGKGGSWLCRCDCGREEIFPAHRLPHSPSTERRRDAVTSCTHCRSQRVCAVCGGAFESRQFRACCSDECHTIHRRAIMRDLYYARVDRDADFNRKRAAVVRSRAQTDPDFARRYAEYEARARANIHARHATDPEYRARVQARYRAKYREVAEIVQARRRARWAAMSPDQQLAHSERRRMLNTAWAQRRREALKQNPTRYREYLDQYNIYCRGWYARRRAESALAGLMDIGQALQAKLERNEDGH